MEGAVRAGVRPACARYGGSLRGRHTYRGAWLAHDARVRQHFASADAAVMAILCSPHVCLTNVNDGVSAQMGQFYVAVYTYSVICLLCLVQMAKV